MEHMIVTDRDGETHVVAAKPGLRIMEMLRELDYGVAAVCGGLCSCGTCHVYVAQQWLDTLPRPQADELELLRELPSYRQSSSRLSCQIEFAPEMSGIEMVIAPDVS